MASMSPELELMIFMTPIFTDKAELALEVFKCVVLSQISYRYNFVNPPPHPSCHLMQVEPTIVQVKALLCTLTLVQTCTRDFDRTSSSSNLVLSQMTEASN